MDIMLYIPGFQEPTYGRHPGNIIEKYCGENIVHFRRLVYPGDTTHLEGEQDKFSMLALTEKIEEILGTIEKGTCVTTYSLGSRPTIDAISRLSDNIKSRIKKLSLIHPARNPLYSIRVRDWLLTDSDTLLSENHYLNGDPEEVFNTLIGAWKGNGMQFQKDLKRYNENRGGIKYLLEGLGIEHLEVSCIDDKVINEGPLGKKRNTLMSHIPNIGDSQIAEMLV